MATAGSAAETRTPMPVTRAACVEGLTCSSPSAASAGSRRRRRSVAPSRIARSVADRAVVVVVVVVLVAVVALAGSARARTLRIPTLTQPPFVFFDEQRPGNDRFSGVVIELMDAVLDLVADDPLFENETLDWEYYRQTTYGSPQADGSWTGIVGEVSRGEADVSASLLTITKDRLQVVSFTPPFLSTGHAILVRKEVVTGSIWAFLSPFSLSMWLAVLAVVAAVILLAWFFDSRTPFGFRAMGEDVHERRMYSLSNSGFHGILSLLGKDFSDPPRAWSLRFLFIGFYVFLFFTVAGFSANLTAQATLKRLDDRISSINDVRQQQLPFAVIGNSSIADFFIRSEDRSFRVMTEHMRSYASLDACLDALRRREVDAVVSPLQMLQYAAKLPPCDTVQVGDTFSLSFWAFATPQNSPLLQALSSAVARRLEDGTVSELVESNINPPGACPDPNEELQTGDGQLTPESFAGVFVFFAIFVVLAGITFALERRLYRLYSENPTPVRRVLFKCAGGVEKEKDEKEEDDGPAPISAAEIQKLSSARAALTTATTRITVTNPLSV